jgi:hypothetical protein
MVYVSLTCIKIKSIWHYIQFFSYAVPIVTQSKGLALETATMARDGYHYTLTVWNDRKEMISFIHSGAHQKATKDRVLPMVASDAMFYSFEATSDEIPDWEKAIDLLHTKGREYNFTKFHNVEAA